MLSPIKMKPQRAGRVTDYVLTVLGLVVDRILREEAPGVCIRFVGAGRRDHPSVRKRLSLEQFTSPRDASVYSASDLISMGFPSTPGLAALVERTKPASGIEVARFDAIVVAGGQSPMFSFEKATALHQKVVEFYEAGKVASALCHGAAVLEYTRLSNGEHLVKGKTVTGFANVEEDFADNAVWDMGALPRDKHLMPWRIEDDFKKSGATRRRASGAGSRSGTAT